MGNYAQRPQNNLGQGITPAPAGYQAVAGRTGRDPNAEGGIPSGGHGGGRTPPPINNNPRDPRTSPTGTPIANDPTKPGTPTRTPPPSDGMLANTINANGGITPAAPNFTSAFNLNRGNPNVRKSTQINLPEPTPAAPVTPAGPTPAEQAAQQAANQAAQQAAAVAAQQAQFWANRNAWLSMQEGGE